MTLEEYNALIAQEESEQNEGEKKVLTLE